MSIRNRLLTLSRKQRGLLKNERERERARALKINAHLKCKGSTVIRDNERYVHHHQKVLFISDPKNNTPLFFLTVSSSSSIFRLKR